MRLCSYKHGPDSVSGLMLFSPGLFSHRASRDATFVQDERKHLYVRVFATPDSDNEKGTLRDALMDAFALGHGLEIVAEDDRLVLSYGEVWSYAAYRSRVHRWWHDTTGLGAIRRYERIHTSVIPLAAQAVIAEIMETLGYPLQLGVYDRGPDTPVTVVLPMDLSAGVMDLAGRVYDREHLLAFWRWYFPPALAIVDNGSEQEYAGPWLALQAARELTR